MLLMISINFLLVISNVIISVFLIIILGNFLIIYVIEYGFIFGDLFLIGDDKIIFGISCMIKIFIGDGLDGGFL